MKKLRIVILLLAIVCIHLDAQTDEQVRAILLLTGSESEETLTEDEVDKYLTYATRPLEINISTKSRLLSSGLMSQYQIASLCDYISTHGDVLSPSELSLIDGFSTDYASALSCFVSFASRELPGAKKADSVNINQELTMRAAFKGSQSCSGAKYKLELDKRMEVAFAARSAYSDPRHLPPSAYSMNITYYGKRRLGKLILGDFNVRFGQGLSLWSGMSMSGLSSSSSFSKRPAGLSPSWSYSGIGSHRGVAADFLLGKSVLSTFVSLPGLRKWCESGKPPEIGLLPGLNYAWYGRRGQISATAYLQTSDIGVLVNSASGVLVNSGSGGSVNSGSGGSANSGTGRHINIEDAKVSVDFRYSFKGIDYFGETAYGIVNKSVASVLGLSFSLFDDSRFSAVARCYPSAYKSPLGSGVSAWTKTSDEYALGIGLDVGAASFTADYAQKAESGNQQVKLLVKAPFQIAKNYVLSLKFAERVRPYELLRYRTNLRCDLDYSSGGLSSRYGKESADSWVFRLRGELMLCRSLSWLAYSEVGRCTGKLSAYLRGTIFIVDNWDDRIYSYERDAPGSFNVPAYYHRGLAFSAVASRKFLLGARKWRFLKANLRLSSVNYFKKTPQPSKFEAKFQVTLNL